MLVRVLAEDEGRGETGLGHREHRTEFGDDDVVLADDPVRGLRAVREQRVRARAHERPGSRAAVPNSSLARSPIRSLASRSLRPGTTRPRAAVVAKRASAMR